ncbi:MULTISPECIES: alpha/beta fold hydrolase [unclassified Streptomyces]|uniref:alpha/beta fold hydrolase n=1 Tax=unclassified Streptomyces TaxID=2593676 RepID=UPI0008850A0B|nr:MULTISPECIES: alpha/beta fold hydrolase [unclassified Streptomyces]PBC86365.1 pimeloyl-ACP methyl ester carboxylesterase [Streptomyces sp. 2321.6]SDQ87034.1 Pimeloyl-ACP methyl ester carboxylesterase [Streptomyces sp. KS_16]SED96155.1 Pimeloyl-ACP methyl ester carboxylesterase [Streptomyces sp. 2133.1]SNC73247.1 Pimeloyl-ACP methyl ester carboxylesterase [Streptomyces sp. 2114.4]
MSLTPAGGLRLHTQRLPGRGDGPTVVFLHGLVMDNLSSFYCTLAGPVSRAGHPVLLYDQRGHGRSDRPPGGYDRDTAAADLAALLGSLGLDRRPVHLVGNSYGGVLALHTALVRPELVASLVLIDAQLTGDWVEDMTDTLSVAALGLEHRRLPEQLAALGRRKEARLTAGADALLNRTSLIEDIAAGAAFTSHDFARLRCPVLAVYGEHSELLPGARELAAGAPDCDLCVLPGVGHTVLNEATEGLCAAVLERLGDRAGAVAR